ncbi:MAG: DUF5110 domain-containing protein [Bacteroidaceae bacterium]|nr:DUF5110 domain-containing protein [Bacteroidaceae bacterium]
MNRIYGLLVALLCVATLTSQTRIDFVTPSIVRVRWSADGVFRGNGTGVCTWQQQDVKVTSDRLGAGSAQDGVRRYWSDVLTVEVDERTGAVTFRDRATGRVLLQEDATCPHEAEPVVEERIVYDEGSARIEETANGKVTVKEVMRRDTLGATTRYRVHFRFTQGEALYGLGSHMEDYMNLMGKTVYLTQHNLKATMPVINSTGGYGLLFDVGCAMKFETRRMTNDELGMTNDELRMTNVEYEGTMQMEAAKEVDYYFIKGEGMDDVVRGYRWLTGDVALMPRYVFGYTQSRERYKSSEEIVNTLREYRRRGVPIDMIVQDWNYWPEGWGYMKMDRRYYPDPKALADSVHGLHAKLMVSIWASIINCPQERDFRERGYMLEHSVYDAFNPEARRYYWKYANDEFFSWGFDAWWCDSSEPLDGDWNRMPEPVDGKAYGWDDHARRWQLNKDILSDALGSERSNLYSLNHARGIYENQRATTSEKRVVNLTRSSYAGQQRYSTIVWNGDTHASWASFRQQIPSGLNYMAAGAPYWTVDVGCFFVSNDGRRWFYTGEFPDGVKDDGYKEFYTRMFQWATFLPVLRSHGTDTPREIWQFGEAGTPYYDAILKMIRLRYSLIPYIYSMAAKQTYDGYTMTRMLAFDYANDPAVLDLKDEYMFGRFLVCPVTHPMSEQNTRRLYLPQLSNKELTIDNGQRKIDNGQWFDYWSGEQYEGGQWIEQEVGIDRLPLFVPSGSIIPTTEVAQYTAAQVGKPVTLHIYPGADAHFDLYEDEGDNYNFENGQYSVIPIDWDEKHQRLTIGRREGSYPGMQAERTFIVEVIGKGVHKEVNYKGKKVSIR